ncbi:MAG: glycosyltransferase family 4 protein, partial [Solirubrobacterales bacterium]|nr:glycosyltransferase family 4 protein [Solirubrobacterales bacterium]
NLTVSLVPAEAVRPAPDQRDYSTELRVLSVGRLEQEKNPLLLADVLALLVAEDRRWRLLICGEGDLAPALARRLEQLGVAERAELLGYVTMGDELFELYRNSHAMLHVSWTEGFPQVIIEAFATGLPVVATDVGGVAAAAGDAALLIAPGDPRAAADALRRLATEPDLRTQLARAGLARAQELTLESQITRLAAFLRANAYRRARAARAAS